MLNNSHKLSSSQNHVQEDKNPSSALWDCFTGRGLNPYVNLIQCGVQKEVVYRDYCPTSHMPALLLRRRSPGFTIDNHSWDFQKKIPCLGSESTLSSETLNLVTVDGDGCDSFVVNTDG
ncbi:uncharacterized [Tachysurus ichikawai]